MRVEHPACNDDHAKNIRSRTMRSGEVEANLLVLNQDFKLSYISDLVERKVNGTEAGRLSSTEKAFHRSEYLRLVSVLEEAAEASTLPDAPTAGPALNDLLVRLRLRRA